MNFEYEVNFNEQPCPLSYKDSPFYHRGVFSPDKGKSYRSSEELFSIGRNPPIDEIEKKVPDRDACRTVSMIWIYLLIYLLVVKFLYQG